MIAIFGIEKYSRDEKAGKNKEQVDAVASGLSRAEKCSRQWAEGISCLLPEEGVEQQHAEHGDSSQGVQFRHERADQRRWLRGSCGRSQKREAWEGCLIENQREALRQCRFNDSTIRSRRGRRHAEKYRPGFGRASTGKRNGPQLLHSLSPHIRQRVPQCLMRARSIDEMAAGGNREFSSFDFYSPRA